MVLTYLHTLVIVFSLSASILHADRIIDFDRQIRPILSEYCFACHGPDANTREANIRLDTREGLFAEHNGIKPVTPGSTLKSAIIQVITSNDDNKIMPPPTTKRKLKQQEIELLKQWITQGATWSAHWAFRPIQPNNTIQFNQHPIDYFITQKAQKQQLSIAPEAPRQSLIRRVTLDLTGLPPTPKETKNFIEDKSPNAYEKVVDRLLASPRYGERMAWEWLDAARYADTDGFQNDPTRSMWPWRDWLINALNNNIKFDQFTKEILAGDMLPNNTKQQRLASAFNRNHTYNNEGGRIPEETRVENVMDRVETTSTIWLGLTVACARCHDHKYDPISHHDYFKLYDIFNQTSETGKQGYGRAKPIMFHTNPEQEKSLASIIKKIKKHNTSNPKNIDHKTKLKTLKKQERKLKRTIPNVMIMDHLPPEKRRKTFILDGGAYDKPTNKLVTAGIPKFLNNNKNNKQNTTEFNRLELAKWLVSNKNPLTSRVIVNRYWQTFFGKGLVTTVEDFGSQGAKPTHPQLLDWLATEFINNGWDVKQIHKTIVTSKTYRQSSKINPKSKEIDPENKLYTHAPRYRMPSWMLRDQALAISGLINTEMGGPGVKPYQPKGIWAEATFGKIKYQPDTNKNIYRRSLYIFWRRIVGPTMFFDNAKRQECEVVQNRTNTPMHALTTLNEPLFVESARAMAERILSLPENKRITFAFQLATARHPEPKETQFLTKTLNNLITEYKKSPNQAIALLNQGYSKRNPKLNPSIHAAWASLCSILLNLDETLTKE